MFGFDSLLKSYWASLVGQVVKNLPASAGDADLIPGQGRYPGEGNGNLLQFYSLENSMGREPSGLYSLRGPKESDMAE